MNWKGFGRKQSWCSEVTVLQFSWKDSGNHRKNTWRYPVSRSRFEPGTCRTEYGDDWINKYAGLPMMHARWNKKQIKFSSSVTNSLSSLLRFRILSIPFGKLKIENYGSSAPLEECYITATCQVRCRHIYALQSLSNKTRLSNKRELTLRSLTLYIYGAPILDVSRSHTTTQHSR